MKYTYSDVKKSIPPIKVKTDSWWSKCGARQISYWLAARFLNFGFTPNMVSVIAIFDALCAAIFMSINNATCIIIGFVCLDLFVMFDCVDGNMARTLKQASYMGEFYDAIGGYTMCAFTLLGVGLCAYNTGKVLFFSNTFVLVLISAIASISDIFSRLIYQKYTANEMIGNSKLGEPLTRENDSYYDEKPRLSLSYLRLVIDRQFGIAGFFPPIVILGFIFNFLDVVIIGYSIYHILGLIAVFIIFCKKATEFDKKHRAGKSF